MAELQRELWDALLAMKETKRFTAFLSNLLTDSEVIMLARRIRIAKMLIAGHSQDAIQRALHCGFPTIQAVDTWLRKDFENYQVVLQPLYEEARRRAMSKARKREPIIPGSFRDLRRKYPLHFLLFNLMLDDL